MPTNSPLRPLIAKARRTDAHRTKAWAFKHARAGAAKAGLDVKRIDDEGRRYVQVSYNDELPLPDNAESTLRSDNPELIGLEQAYAALDIPATAHSQWRAGFLKKSLSMAWFRGDNAYVWQFRQLRTAARARMYLQLLDVEGRDTLGLLRRLPEDALFGAWLFTYGQRPPVSRDLLDSVNEINYLEKHTGLSEIPGLRVLDIGAGYGRLAYRMSTALDNLEAYDCIDGVATSTFLCDYYLRFREAPESVRTVRLDEHETLADRYDICVNIHSFAECSLQAIEWWLQRIAERQIEWLLIVPNSPPELLSTEVDGSKRDFMPLVLDAGYELVDSSWTHENDELRELIDVDDKFYLFRRSTPTT
ncbi:hypothetical protein GCM10027020_36160 [Nocardioides salsibiostraticola]